MGGDEAVAAARLTARRRLIGAVVLLAAGVVGFPILFETQPRPLSADLPIVTAQGESPRAPASAPRAIPPRGAVDAGEPASVLPPAPTREAASQPAPAPSRAMVSETPAASTPQAASRPTATATPPAAAVEPARPAPAPVAAPPSPTPKPVAPRPEEPPAAEGRFVVQVGAYADAATLRETRQKVEKLGLKTYTQVIENDAGRRTRVRVGPFATRAEAQAAAARLKAAGLPGNLLTL